MDGASEPGTLFVGFSDKPRPASGPDQPARPGRRGRPAWARPSRCRSSPGPCPTPGVPVFAADVKGDLSGISQPGAPNEKMLARARCMNLTMTPAAPPTIFWTCSARRAIRSAPRSREWARCCWPACRELNEVGEGVLNIVTCKVADAEGLLLLDLKDLQAALAHVAESEEASTPG